MAVVRRLSEIFGSKMTQNRRIFFWICPEFRELFEKHTIFSKFRRLFRYKKANSSKFVFFVSCLHSQTLTPFRWTELIRWEIYERQPSHTERQPWGSSLQRSSNSDHLRCYWSAFCRGDKESNPRPASSPGLACVKSSCMICSSLTFLMCWF